MYVTCLDLEGVLVPEIWIAFAEKTGISELRLTTRDISDYDVLMKKRLGILKEHSLGLKAIQDVIAQIDPMPGAKEFLDALRERHVYAVFAAAYEKTRHARNFLQRTYRRTGRHNKRLQAPPTKRKISRGMRFAVYRF